MIIKLFISMLFTLIVVSTFAAETKLNQLASDEDSQKIQKTITEIFKLYEVGNLALLQNKFNPSIIGLQKLMNSIAIESAQCKQVRVHLTNTKIIVGTDVAVLQTGWEKRCLQMPNLTPQLQTGEGSFILHKSTFGWQIAGLTGLMPFTSVKFPVSLTASTTTTCATIMATSTIPVLVPFTITLIDPNIAKQNTIQIQVTTANDSETLTLTAVPNSAGTFRVTTVLAHQGFSSTSNNGSLQVQVSGATCSNVKLNYTSSSIIDGVKTYNKTVNWL